MGYKCNTAWVRLVIVVCGLGHLAETAPQCMVPGVTSSCVVSPSGGVTWSLDVKESATWWMLISFQQPRMVDRVEIKALSPQHPTPLSSVLLQFSDGTTSQMSLTSEGGLGSLEGAVLTHGVTVSASSTPTSSTETAGDGAVTVTALSYSFTFYTVCSTTGVVVTAAPMCSYAHHPCAQLLDGSLLTSYMVMPDQRLTFTFPASTAVSGVAFLEANKDGPSSYRRFRIDTPNMLESFYGMCELPGERGVSWQHVLFASPITTDELTIVFDHPIYQLGIVWGLLETRFYTTDGSSIRVGESTLCYGERRPVSRRMNTWTLPGCACVVQHVPYIAALGVLGAALVALIIVIIVQARRMRGTPPAGGAGYETQGARTEAPTKQKQKSVKPNKETRPAERPKKPYKEKKPPELPDKTYHDSYSQGTADKPYEYMSPGDSQGTADKPYKYMSPGDSQDTADKPYEYMRPEDVIYRVSGK